MPISERSGNVNYVLAGYGFKQRVDNSLNKVVNTVANTTLLSSRLRKHWRIVLYRLPAA